MKPHVLNPHELHCLENAVRFVAVRGKTTTRVRLEFSSMEEAEDFAKQFNDGKTMIYAITATDAASHIKNL